ncbi:putative E3 ubiquitin-protein ligase HERC4 [Dirofilaria immitis]|nr:putative E3 ubiquitin-protein ligase HERC4 [Dirofilaria immitis]
MARRQLYVFGCAGDGQLGFRPNAAGVDAEMMISLNWYMVWSCGSNYNGELGRGGVKEGSYTIYPVHISSTVSIIQISAGRSHSMAVSDDGRLFAWGSNSHGQLAMSNDILNSDTPKRVPSLPETVQVACGASHTVSLNGGGRVFIWGQQYDGRIRHSPAEVEIFVSIPVIQRNLFTMALTASGTLFAWGKNEEGQLGDFTNKNVSNPCEVPNINSVVTVECGDSHAIALTHEGRVFSCGSDSFGQLGCGQPSRSQNCMRAITEMLGSHVTRIACGRCHTIVVANGKMHTFGLNSNGQLGHGNTRNQITPRVIDSISNVASIFAGWDQSFCLQEVLSGPNSYLQKPKYLSLRRIRDLFSVADKLTIIGELESVFSSLSSINASFLYENEKRYRCSASNSCLDLDHVVQASSIISENVDADQYAEIMLTSLDAAGMWELSWEKITSLESLRVYLILPSLYLFSSPSYASVKTLHLPFVRSIQLLREADRKVLEKWWSLFERRHFNRLVSALVKALEQLVEHEPNNTSDAIPFCSILSRLNAINRSQKLIAYDKFYLHNLQKKLIWPMISLNGNSVYLVYSDVKMARFCKPHPFFELAVHRDNIVDDAMVALLSSKEMDLKKPLKVHFIGEEADDAGGVKKEFFMLLFQELLQAKYGMFTENDESHLIWFSGVETDPLSFKLVGRLCALAIYNSVLVDFPFPLALYKKILDVPLELEDLSELSPAEGRSLRSLLDYEEDDIEEVFCLTFMISISLLGDSKDVELKENGAEIPVNQRNKHEFVQVLSLYKETFGRRLRGEIGRQMLWFTEGFGSAMHSKIMNFFQPQELMEMVVGNENYDWNLFRNGMSAVKMRIQPCDEEALPVAHTCFNLLDLPNITDREEMRRRLLICLDHSHGFNLV